MENSDHTIAVGLIRSKMCGIWNIESTSEISASHENSSSMLGQGSWMTQQWKYRSIEIHHSPSLLFVLVWPTPTSCLDCYNWLLMGFPASICAPPDQCQFRTTQWLFVFKIRSCHVSIINLFSPLPPPHTPILSKILTMINKAREETENSLVSAGCTHAFVEIKLYPGCVIIFAAK